MKLGRWVVLRKKIAEQEEQIVELEAEEAQKAKIELEDERQTLLRTTQEMAHENSALREKVKIQQEMISDWEAQDLQTSRPFESHGKRRLRTLRRF